MKIKILNPLFNWDNIDYPKDKLEWIIVDDSKTDYSNDIPIHENILYMKVDSDEYLDKIEFPKDENKKLSGIISKKLKNLQMDF